MTILFSSAITSPPLTTAAGTWDITLNAGRARRSVVIMWYLYHGTIVPSAPVFRLLSVGTVFGSTSYYIGSTDKIRCGVSWLDDAPALGASGVYKEPHSFGTGGLRMYVLEGAEFSESLTDSGSTSHTYSCAFNKRNGAVFGSSAITGTSQTISPLTDETILQATNGSFRRCFWYRTRNQLVNVDRGVTWASSPPTYGVAAVFNNYRYAHVPMFL